MKMFTQNEPLKQGGCLIPMMMLCHEHEEDPEMRPEPISPEKQAVNHYLQRATPQ